ncbi:hypothetical protein GCM10023085_49190 [Actinomadura viridis]|uniref:Integral membrane protein n=1 Tax=Actinomadura viridis TaxID=58110 RepID=A0A931DKW4_9ACTN|nr:hypothetical protein [Actinomadura viridis]MBG6090579.1 hypothetical protein [Actinomadura viridis]
MTTHSMNETTILTGGRRLLRLALRLDAVVTGVNGLAYLALAGPLHDLLGLGTGTGRAIGAFLLLYAAAVWIVSLPVEPRRLAVSAVIETNLLWVVLSLTAVVTGWLSLTTVGSVWAILQAGTVGAFAALQFAARRRA